MRAESWAGRVLIQWLTILWTSSKEAGRSVSVSITMVYLWLTSKLLTRRELLVNHNYRWKFL